MSAPELKKCCRTNVTDILQATDKGDLPTARAITERLVKIRQLAVKNGAKPFGISSAQSKGVSRKASTPRKTPTSTPSKRKHTENNDRRGEDSEDEEVVTKREAADLYGHSVSRSPSSIARGAALSDPFAARDSSGGVALNGTTHNLSRLKVAPLPPAANPYGTYSTRPSNSMSRDTAAENDDDEDVTEVQVTPRTKRARLAAALKEEPYDEDGESRAESDINEYADAAEEDYEDEVAV